MTIHVQPLLFFVARKRPGLLRVYWNMNDNLFNYWKNKSQDYQHTQNVITGWHINYATRFIASSLKVAQPFKLSQ